MNRRAGLLGVGTYLPPQRRANDWWPEATVDSWRHARRVLPPLAEGEPTQAMARVLAALAEQAFDPFQGVAPDSVEAYIQVGSQAVMRHVTDRG